MWILTLAEIFIVIYCIFLQRNKLQKCLSDLITLKYELERLKPFNTTSCLHYFPIKESPSWVKPEQPSWPFAMLAGLGLKCCPVNSFWSPVIVSVAPYNELQVWMRFRWWRRRKRGGVVLGSWARPPSHCSLIMFSDPERKISVASTWALFVLFLVVRLSVRLSVWALCCSVQLSSSVWLHVTFWNIPTMCW